MRREYYSDRIATFLDKPTDQILGELQRSNNLDSAHLERTQSEAWGEQIRILKEVLMLHRREGKIYFEYSIPRLGRRIDVVLLLGPVIFVLEFKVYDEIFKSYAIDQVWDYALDLKNFHETSHEAFIAPILIATGAKQGFSCNPNTPQNDRVLAPIRATPESLTDAIDQVLQFAEGIPIDPAEWEGGRYSPTPTIIEAATALYRGHSVDEIARSEAEENLGQTSDSIAEIIRSSREYGRKSICFVTGVPGAGKTLVGLNIATKHIEKSSELYSVFLSGNGPLVAVLREALTRDKFRQEKESDKSKTKGEVMREVKLFIQNVHNFRDDCIIDTSAPKEHVALFDEAQRAWTLQKTSSFMRRRKKVANFRHSEPEFLVSCLDRHKDWAVVVCLVGGGQEIHEGEAGISEWIESLKRSFPKWDIYISSRLTDSEYGAGNILQWLDGRPNVTFHPELHLSVSMRSFRAENVSLLVKQLLDLEVESARATLNQIRGLYPILITREVRRAKEWLRDQGRGNQRYGIVASSHAERLKPHAIYVKAEVNPVYWFLNGKDDVRSSYYLEDVATEFDVQGLELDWSCVTWDADFRYGNRDWEHWSFQGKRWRCTRNATRKLYQKNAYRVLLTRARQGMVIVIPEGDPKDHTRKPEYYDPTFEYLSGIGFQHL